MIDAKYTAPQLYEILCALHFGMSNAAWEGLGAKPWLELTRAEREAQVAGARRKVEAMAAQLESAGVDLKLNRDFLARFDLTAIEQEEQKEREYRTAQAGSKPTLSGLRQAVNDLLSQARHFSAEQELAADRRLAAAALPPVRVLSGALQRQLRAILKRGRIRDEEEYYVVREIVCDQNSGHGEAERDSFERLLADFEAQGGGRKP